MVHPDRTYKQITFETFTRCTPGIAEPFLLLAGGAHRFFLVHSSGGSPPWSTSCIPSSRGPTMRIKLNLAAVILTSAMALEGWVPGSAVAKAQPADAPAITQVAYRRRPVRRKRRVVIVRRRPFKRSAAIVGGSAAAGAAVGALAGGGKGAAAGALVGGAGGLIYDRATHKKRRVVRR